MIAQDIAIQTENKSIQKSLRALEVLDILLSDGKSDGVISTAKLAALNKLGWNFDKDQTKKAVWDMVRTGLAIDKLTEFTGTTTDFEYLKVETMFPKFDQSNESTMAQLKVSLTLVRQTYNDNIERLKVNRAEGGAGFGALTENDSTKEGPIEVEEEEEVIVPIPESYKDFTVTRER